MPRVIFDGAIHLGDPEGSDIEVALLAPQAVVHPHGVVLSSVSGGWPFADLHLGSEVTIGGRAIRWEDVAVQVTRWWTPTPALGPTERDRLVAAARSVRAMMVDRVPPLDPGEAERLQQLVTALHAGDGSGAAAAALRLLGLGTGATPTGDDLVAGLVAGIDRFGSALLPPPEAQVLAAARAAVDAVLARCDAATTALSASLLRHAACGQVCRPAGRLIVVMARGLDEHTLREALDGLLAVGSSSGRDLTLGLLAAVDALAHGGASPPVVTHTLADVPTHLDVRAAPVGAISPSAPVGATPSTPRRP